jgi:hypothetical protein
MMIQAHVGIFSSSSSALVFLPATRAWKRKT